MSDQFDYKMIIREFFYAVSLLLPILLVMEFIWPGIVLAYLDTNLILLFWLILGIFIVVFDRKNNIL